MAEKKPHWKTLEKLAKESVEGSVDSIPEAPEAPELVEEYRIMDKRGDIVGYASSKKEAVEKVGLGGYIVKV